MIRFGVVGYDLVLRRLGPSGTRVRSRRKPEFGCSFWVTVIWRNMEGEHTHTQLVGTKCLWSIFFWVGFGTKHFGGCFFFGGSPQYRISGSNMLMLFSPKCHEQVSVFSRTQVALPHPQWFWLRPMENSRRFQRLETSSVFLFQKKSPLSFFHGFFFLENKNSLRISNFTLLYRGLGLLKSGITLQNGSLELSSREPSHPYVPWSKVAILGMVIPPLIGILIIGI